MAALQFVTVPGYSALILRRSVQDLALPGALMDRAFEWLSPTDAKWREQKKQWEFPGGATLNFGYLEYEKDKYRYQSSEFDCIEFDELTQFARTQYTYMFSRLRKSSSNPYPVRMRSASNPGNEGHEFVKQRFVDPGDPDRPFVPARVVDNPFIDQESYLFSLAQLDPVTRAQLEQGVWDEPTPEGSYYGKLIEAAEQGGRVGNVPHDPGLLVDTWWDLGIAAGRDSMVVLFTQTYAKEIRLIDSYGNSGEGFPFYAKMLADKGYHYGTHNAPHDIKVKELGTGKSRQEQAGALGLTFEQVPDVGFDSGINAMRTIIPRLWIDKGKNEKLLRAWKNYRKEWDEEHQCFKNNPRKDWTNDYADAGRMLAVGYQEPIQYQPIEVRTGFDARNMPSVVRPSVIMPRIGFNARRY